MFVFMNKYIYKIETTHIDTNFVIDSEKLNLEFYMMRIFAIYKYMYIYHLYIHGYFNKSPGVSTLIELNLKIIYLYLLIAFDYISCFRTHKFLKIYVYNIYTLGRKRLRTWYQQK